ncbi:MAG: Serine-type D-Ala-D-Ala carboxypeptidase [Xanthobacteraceae bacterium]|nr:Serine-type D-Ala-D-Ala carboxypeptidase [Xanthobacteraceae bacterium]
MLLIEARSGKVLHAENATMPWYPASLSKLMTAYVTLHAMRQRRVAPDTLLTVSDQAVAQQPSKMGFAAGTQVTVDNALKMLMVKSANDMAVVLAEGVSGSIDKFAEEMTASAQRLGMTQSHYVNPNGLPDERQVTSARDQAILARALIVEFPEHDDLWSIPAIKFGKRVMRNHNPLIGRYPGADGMKTGFICASGFNVVTSATRDGKRLIAVVLGSPSTSVRSYKTAQLLEKGFSGTLTSWLTPSLGSVEGLTPINATPPNLTDETCGRNRKRPAAEDEGEEVANGADSGSPYAIMLTHLRAPTTTNIAAMLAAAPAPSVPVMVGIGAKKPAPATMLASVGGTVPAATPAAAAALVSAARANTTVVGIPLPRPRPKMATRAAAEP